MILYSFEMTIVDVQKNNALMADEGSTENAMGTCFELRSELPCVCCTCIDNVLSLTCHWCIDEPQTNK